MTSSRSARRARVRSSRALLVILLGGAIGFSDAAHAQQSPIRGGGQYTDRPSRGGHYGRGSGGAGVAGAIIGLGAGLLIGGAAAREEREQRRTRREPVYREEVVDERVIRRRPEKTKPRKAVVEVEPRREAGPKRKRPVEPKPKLVRTTPTKQTPPTKPPVNPPPSAPPPAPLAGPAVVAAAPGPSFVPDEVLFEVRAGVGEAEVVALANLAGLERISAETFGLTGSTVYRYRITGGRSVSAVVSALDADARVKTAQPNNIFTLSLGPTSSLASSQYAVAKLRLGEAHASATGSNVTIAVIDSGVDARHPSLRGAVVDVLDAVGGAFAPHAHGTAIAGLAAGRGDLASPAPAARLISVRAFAPDQPAQPGAQGTTMHILRGLDWAAARGTKVVNMSFTGSRDAKIAEFIAAGAAKGEIHVAAAGNAGPSSPPLFPAADPNVIAVTATDAADGLLGLANRGPHVSVAAPGVDVLVAAPGGGFGYESGTSMASAEIAGVVALLAQANPLITTEQARVALTASARDLGAPGPDPDFGAGAADARGALDAIGVPTLAPAIAEAKPAIGPKAELTERR